MSEEENVDSTTENNSDEVDFDVPEGDSLDSIEVAGEEEAPAEEEETKEDPKGSLDELERVQRRNRTLERKYNKAADDLSKRREERPEAPRTLTEEEAKEEKAAKYIEDQVRLGVEKIESEKADSEQEKRDALSEQLDVALDRNPDISESDTLDLIETYAERGIRLSPEQAVQLVKEPLSQLPAKPKPQMPTPERGTGEVKSELDKVDESKLSYDERIEHIKKWGKEQIRSLSK